MKITESKNQLKDSDLSNEINEKTIRVDQMLTNQQEHTLEKQETIPEEETSTDPLPRSTIFMIIWTVIFGTTLAIGGSILEPLPIPWLNITLASPLVALLITLNKLVLNKRFSVTYMYIIAGTIAIFTTYLGPPTILKPLYLLAGLSFDAATFFRTKDLKFWNLILGHLAITVTGFFIFWLIFLVMLPDMAQAVGKILLIASPVHFLVSVAVAAVVYKTIPPTNLPDFVVRIRSQVED